MFVDPAVDAIALRQEGVALLTRTVAYRCGLQTCHPGGGRSRRRRHLQTWPPGGRRIARINH